MLRERRFRRWLLASALAVVVWGPATAQDSAVPQIADPGQLLVGAYVRHREIGTLDIYVIEDEYLIPLETFADLTGCQLTVGATGASLKTPIGIVHLPPEDLRDSQSTLYISDKTIEEKLATPVSFDVSRYALEFDTPWLVGSAATTAPARYSLVAPDVTPPSASLSTVHADLRYTRISEVDALRGTTVLGGALAGGYWRMRYDNSLAGQHTLQEYAWLYRRRNHLWLAGDQRIRLHPLLRGIEFTGLQYATTNHSLRVFQHGPTPTELLSRRMQPITTFEGYGPPAGIAELWIEGVVIERHPIGLDGRYQFLDVTIPARQSNRVEIRLYDRHNPGVPIEILEQTRTASAFLLPGGTRMHMGGGGAEGNLFQDALIENRRDSGFAGFYQTRHGLSDTLTLEAAVQGTEDVTQLLGGYVARLSPTFVMSMGLGASDSSAFGASLDLEGLSAPWRFFAHLQAAQDGFDPLFPQNTHDHHLELGRRVGAKLDLALVGRSRLAPSRNVDYLLPAVTWSPIASLWMRARPDNDGDYRFDLGYQIAPRTRLSFHAVEQERALAQLFHEISRRLRMTAEGEYGEGLPSRGAVVFTGYDSSRWRTTWIAGPQVTGGKLGYILGGRVTLVPGIVAQAQVESEARTTDPQFALEPRVRLNLVADLGFSRGRFISARSADVRVDRGGIAGTVRIDAPPGFPRFDLRGLTVRLDGRPLVRTEGGGAFFIGSLEPGIYRLELDSENLPIELAPFRTVLHAKVAGAAVTRLNFVVRPEFGIAGRLRDASGEPVAGLKVELLDGSRAVVATAVTDRFGLYRMDGLPIGTYMLRLKPGILPYSQQQPSRIVQIENDFLFDQDLQLPVILEEDRTTGSRS